MIEIGAFQFTEEDMKTAKDLMLSVNWSQTSYNRVAKYFLDRRRPELGNSVGTVAGMIQGFLHGLALAELLAYGPEQIEKYRDETFALLKKIKEERNADL